MTSPVDRINMTHDISEAKLRLENAHRLWVRHVPVTSMNRMDLEQIRRMAVDLLEDD